jgi:hypothetical protein
MAVTSTRTMVRCIPLDTLAADEVPLWAAHWLVDGYDGEALRTLAGLSGFDPYDVREILPAALADCAVAIPESLRRAADVVFTAMAGMCLRSESPRDGSPTRCIGSSWYPSTTAISPISRSGRYTCSTTSGARAGAAPTSNLPLRFGSRVALNWPLRN